MGHAAAQVHFAALDPTSVRSARAAVAYVEQHAGQPVNLELDASVAALVRRILAMAADAGGIAYGPVGADLSPEQAGKILGVSRPLVVQRMEDGRLPFQYVGTHRRCRLTDVLALKAAEAKQNQNLAAIYEDLMDLDEPPSP